MLDEDAMPNFRCRISFYGFRAGRIWNIFCIFVPVGCLTLISFVHYVMKLKITPIFIILSAALDLAAQSVNPSPRRFAAREGSFCIGREIAICCNDTTAGYFTLFRDEFAAGAGLHLTCDTINTDVAWITDSTIPTEGYEIDITPRRMEIRASDAGGFVYAVQTLRQLAVSTSRGIEFRCMSVSDEPRMRWRAFMLDSGRQFQPVEVIKKYIDMASMLKMNRFHWHLTEGLGWRIEIKRYPLLALKGAFVGKSPGQQGYYTQDEIRMLVDYARRRKIEIVPEIDMPGHAEAAIFSYPGLGCFGDRIEIPQTGFTPNIFCAGNDSTLVFLKNVLDEVCELFPSEYIHLGGDEAPKDNWEKCPSCRARLAREHLADTHALQLWLSAEMARHLKSKGRKAIFWDDVVAGEGYRLPDNSVIQWWNYRGHGSRGLRNALSCGLEVICSPNYYTYLNFPLTPWRGYGQERTFDLADVYIRNPADSAFNEGNPSVMGMTCALWTDYGVTEDMIDRRLFPRILALAEQMWHRDDTTPAPEDFYRRIDAARPFWESEGYEFGPAFRQDVPPGYTW